MVRTIFIACIGLFLAACRPDGDSATLVVEGTLVAGEQPDVRVYLLEDFIERDADDLEVFLVNEDGVTVQLMAVANDPRRFIDEDETMAIIPEKTYRIEVTRAGITAEAEARVPPDLQIVQISSTTIPVNSASTGQPVFTVLWTADPNASKVLSLIEPSEENEIPFSVESGNFSEQYRLPIPGQGTTLFDTDFKYYGTHTLRIYNINRSYEDLFFYVPADGGARLTTGPSNIDNGAGYFTAVNFTDIEIEILE